MGESRIDALERRVDQLEQSFERTRPIGNLEFVRLVIGTAASPWFVLLGISSAILYCFWALR